MHFKFDKKCEGNKIKRKNRWKRSKTKIKNKFKLIIYFYILL